MKYIKQEKLNKIKLNKDNMYVVIDFDKTITSTKSEDSWDVTGKCLGKEFNQKLGELYQKYRPIELNYKITFEDKNYAMQKWYKECMDLYYNYHLTENKLQETIKKSNLIFRRGAEKFLEQMDKNNVPVIILSAGIGNIIELFLKENKCYYKHISIISNFIEFDEKGKMKKIEREIIHSLNKNMEGHLPEQIKEKIMNKKYRLLIGDALEDKKMVRKEEWKDTISVGLLNENIEENLEIYRKNFDLVLTNQDANFMNINKIVF